MPVNKDLVPNLNQLYKQYQSIEPWLQVEKEVMEVTKRYINQNKIEKN